VDDFEQMLEKYRDQNYQLKVQVTRVIEDVASNITDKLSELGTTAMLTIEQEDSLVEIAEDGRKEVDGLFNQGMQLDTELSQIMTQMRTDETSTADDNADDDSIDFF